MSDGRRTTDAGRRGRGRAARRPSRRVRWGALAALLALALALPLAASAQSGQNRAGLVIKHGDGRLIKICLHFDEPTISGIQLLERAGVSYLAQSGGMGSAVCKLDGEGCDYPTEDCFCRCTGADCAYWAYQHLRDGKWSYSSVGAAAYTLHAGDVDGWAWGSGSVQAGAQPPLLRFDQICTEAAAPPPATEAAPPTTAEPPTQIALQPTAAPPTQIALQPTAARPVPASPQPRPTRAPPAPTRAALATALPPTAAPALAATTAPATAEPQPTVVQMTPPPIAATTVPPTRPPATRAPAPTLGPAGAAAPQAGGAASATGYLAFGALALLLIGAIIGVLLRRRAARR